MGSEKDRELVRQCLHSEATCESASKTKPLVVYRCNRGVKASSTVGPVCLAADGVQCRKWQPFPVSRNR